MECVHGRAAVHAALYACAAAGASTQHVRGSPLTLGEAELSESSPARPDRSRLKASPLDGSRLAMREEDDHDSGNSPAPRPKYMELTMAAMLSGLPRGARRRRL